MRRDNRPSRGPSGGSHPSTLQGGNQRIGRLRYKLDLENIRIEHGLSNSYEDKRKARLVLAERNLELFRSKVVYWEGQVRDLKAWLEDRDIRECK